MKKFLLILCLLAFTGAAYAEVDYNRNYSPLSVGETDKYFKDLNSWDSRNLYVPGQPYNQPYDYSYQGGYDPSQFGYRERTIDSGDGQNSAAAPKMVQLSKFLRRVQIPVTDGAKTLMKSITTSGQPVSRAKATDRITDKISLC